MERVKFSKGVTEEVRQEVREIMCGKVFMTPLFRRGKETNPTNFV